MKKDSTQQIKNKDPFLLRAIEYWLDSANELGYQPLFCEWLISRGYVLKYSIKNTNFEQGKDVVALAPNGEPHAFQLKGGKITLNRWRTEVKPEIDAMIDCPIQHPDIDKNKPHVSYLVTNDEIDDAVRVEIVLQNDGRWKATPLQVWTRGDLLSGFQGMAEGIFPKDAPTYKELIDLMFVDGTGFPDISRVNNFLSQILNIVSPSLKKEQRRRDIAAAVLYATMIAGPYRKSENHGSTVRVMVLLLSLIFHLVDKYELEDKYWIGSYEIIWNDIIVTARLLESEVNGSGFDFIFTTPFDGVLIPFRKYTASSITIALKASEFINREETWKNILTPEVAEKYKGSIMPWSEASLIPLIFLICIFKNSKETEEMASSLSKTVISIILNFNGRKSKHPIGLLPPHFDINFAIRLQLGLLEQEFEDKYIRSSYLLKPIVEIMVRLGKRENISENWTEISFMHFEEFVPKYSEDYLLWEIAEGENRTILPPKEKSWNEMIKETNHYIGQTLPPTLKRFPAFLPFFLAVFPHRVNSETIGFLYKTST